VAAVEPDTVPRCFVLNTPSPAQNIALESVSGMHRKRHDTRGAEVPLQRRRGTAIDILMRLHELLHITATYFSRAESSKTWSRFKARPAQFLCNFLTSV
jgi:hypothetical protein